MALSSAGIFLRGLLMGAADIVPGVSGGTVAFITGIYDQLLDSLRAVDLEFLARLSRLDIAGAWQHINGRFLLALLLGIATSIFSLAQLVSWVLEHHPVPLWAFFFGLILASALVLLREVDNWSVPKVLCLLSAGAVALCYCAVAGDESGNGPCRCFFGGLSCGLRDDIAGNIGQFYFGVIGHVQYHSGGA